MPLILDSHVHIYKNYDLSRLLASVHKNFTHILTQIGPSAMGATRAIILTEREQCSFFRSLADRHFALSGFELCPLDGSQCLSVTSSKYPPLLVFSGRQVACAERLEAHALLVDVIVPDGTPISEARTRYLEAGAVLSYPWALGKWLGERREIMLRLLEQEGRGSCLISDPALRPSGYPTPGLYDIAAERGISCIYGTDPLPIAGEEERIGAYATFYGGSFDQTHPSAEMRRVLLTSPASELVRVGRRLGVLGCLRRMGQLRLR